MTTLEERIAAFTWPAKESVPTTLEGAWAFVAANPFPEKRYVLAPAGATGEALAAAEEALERPLPAVLRAALAAHDGIEETWTCSGCVLASAAQLAEEQSRFAEELENWETEVDLPLESLFAIGHEADGHTTYLLDTGRTSESGEPMVRRFDPESDESLSESAVRWVSLGHFIAWLVCDAHTHPQKEPPPQLLALFPYDGPDGDGEDDDGEDDDD